MTYPAASLQWMSLHAPAASPALPVTSLLQQRGCVSLVPTSIYTGTYPALPGWSRKTVWGQVLALFCCSGLQASHVTTTWRHQTIHSEAEKFNHVTLPAMQPCYTRNSYYPKPCYATTHVMDLRVPAAREPSCGILPNAHTRMRCTHVLLSQTGRCIPAGQRTMAHS